MCRWETRSHYDRGGKTNMGRLWWVGVCKQIRGRKVVKGFWVVKVDWSFCLNNWTQLQTVTSGQRIQVLCQQTEQENQTTVDAQ